MKYSDNAKQFRFGFEGFERSSSAFKNQFAIDS